MVSLTVKIIYDEIRSMNSWFVYMNSNYEQFMELLIQAHLDIQDIFISPTACFLLFPIDYEPMYGKVYKDMFLIHPSEMPENLSPVFCTNDRLLNTCFPKESDMKEMGVKCKNINRINYISVLDDKNFIMNAFINENYHLVGVYCKDLLDKVREDVVKNDNIKNDNKLNRL